MPCRHVQAAWAEGAARYKGGTLWKETAAPRWRSVWMAGLPWRKAEGMGSGGHFPDSGFWLLALLPRRGPPDTA